MKRIDLHIDELVLPGTAATSPAARRRAAAELERALRDDLPRRLQGAAPRRIREAVTAALHSHFRSHGRSPAAPAAAPGREDSR